MKPAPSPDDSLLSDVLGETAPDEFRAALLADTLRRARIRRRLRRARTTAFIVLLPLLLATLLVIPRRPAPLAPAITNAAPPARGAAPAFCEILSTRAGSAPVVSTRPLDAAESLSSVSLADSAHVRTDPRHAARLIDDAELLALAAPRPAALVRIGPGIQRLVFADDSPVR